MTSAALVLTGCLSSSAGQGGDDTIRIGISLPLTGDFSEPGKGVRRGYEAWADYVNARGGLLGRRVELMILDDQSSADRVAADYEKLINQNGADLVFGPFSTRLVIPAAQVAKDYGFLFVEPAGAAEEVFAQGFDNLFYAAPAVAEDHYNHLAAAILAMPPERRPKTAAYAAMDDPFAQGTAYGLKEKLERAGIRTVVDEVYPPNTTDFGSIAAKIADSRADLVVGGTQYQDAVNLIVTLRQLGYQPAMAAFSTAPTNPEFPKAIGAQTEGILSPTGYTPEADYPSNKEFVAHYTAMHGSTPTEDEANAWTTGQVVAAAVQAVGCADPDLGCQRRLIDWLHANSVDTVVGKLSWDATGKPQGAHLIQQYVGGQIRIVLPADTREADLVHPKPTW
ncbi:amino acid/amide ABC transporter substrate-binding protein (HAAT family) [Saccharopolyspora erythraea NRRL 2338]|uniref:Branched-chain amino acid binding protein n=1 Tax=Saccharopolyspora erythraea (strain ATCC 11635 / DSM 40517 / JCM 4748 / NBRC 13426 / NCIMB 8594 / NRRL 2338) TaxID=405948 RepID=A4FIM5_SACEN|nr:amino acid ABC transporter substrate-binding protein [Saccharopolyspora erythraea]EQD87835.1 branched-chain amino acid ABC transporter substrate-binding protein [Saccharopolyspora erythraea D]PFG97575.1 amino acid/amide ABC transporter substrate-binding protein (HAAT family) [Saccharopolyspora erythraea NRRL 2338]QRK87740.1 amino acid ABC transporter substrate-binding protein [Saccharopolyspora erythraea]CAM03900.1 putative branched-chain amino acid binding protein [Saccharopolyspora erythra